MSTSCKQRPALEEVVLPEVKGIKELDLVVSGVSSQASFSPDGKRLLFVSAKRHGHNHPQIYEKDLSSGSEKRITFQNGATAFPRYHPKENLIVYSSSTDELKENSPLLAEESGLAPQKIPAAYQLLYEIYSHSLERLEINRLTRHSGFDGEAYFSPDGREIFFTRASKENVGAMVMKRGSSAAQPVRGIGKHSSHYMTSANGKQKAWIEWDDSYGVGRLKVQLEKAAPIELTQDMVVAKTDLAFSGDGKWLVWSQFNTQTKTYQLWLYEIDTKCTRRLTSNTDGDRRYAVFTPDSKGLVVTATRKDRSRIVQRALEPVTGPCVSSSQAVP